MAIGTKQCQINLKFKPVNEQQAGFMESSAPRLLFSGAFGAGKTVALCAKGLKLSLDYPHNYGLICRKVRATLGQTTIKTFLERVCPQELIESYNKSEGLITLTNGSQILFGGLDDPLKLGSLELGWAGIDEAIESVEDDWNMIEGRLRLADVPHVIMAATNPGPPAHYLHRMFFTLGKGEVYQAGTLDNPQLPEDYRQRMQEFEGTYYDRYVLGQWVGMEGLVYSAFDEKGCVIPRFEIPKSWLVYSGHDFGDAHTVALFLAENPGTGEFFGFSEYLPGSEKGIHDHVQDFKEITAGYNVIRRAGGNHAEGQIRQGYASQGWPISEPKHSMDTKLQRKLVQGLFRLNKVYIFNDMVNCHRELLSMAYKKDGSTLTDQIENESRFHLLYFEWI
jgi:PBSX family phage terminase large subunit